MPNKTLFDAIEAEARTMGNALNKLGAFMRMVQNAVDQLAEETGIDLPLSLNDKRDLVMKKHVFEASNDVRAALSERMSEGLINAVHMALGGASVCWSNVDGAGNYDATQVGTLASELCHAIADEIDAERDAACGYIESTGRSEL